MEDYNLKWEEIKESIKIEYAFSDISYNTWIKPLKLHRIDHEKKVIVISLPFDQPHSVNYIRDRYSNPIKVAIIESLDLSIDYDIEFVLEKDLDQFNKKNSHKVDDTLLANANLNPKYTFDTFVVGGNNRFAHSAALAVAESPGDVYNPLFIYGGVGLGKTHLMHAIGNFIIENNHNKKVLYVTSEQFTNEVIEAIRIGNNSPTAMKKFREKYRNIDALLIDDIQFIIGKESTQEEFFHTFNQLHEEKKQIIISSDKPPKDMDILEERFKSRFEWGLTADIQSPDYETRMAILQKKKETDGYSIDGDVIKYIADNIKSNIRELEGALNKIIAYSKLGKREIDMDLAEEALKDIIAPNVPSVITPEIIIDLVCKHFNISEKDILSRKRTADIVVPRHIIMYLCRKYTDASLNKIASLLGKKDHTTVLHGEKKIMEEMETDDYIKNTIQILENKIESN